MVPIWSKFVKFQVENRGSISSINPSLKHVVISISDPEQGKANVAETEHLRDILFLEFHDINRATSDMILFDESHADQILKFFDRYKGEVDLVIAHCNAGMSRSPAVVAALQKILTGDDSVWFKSKTPNSLVYRTILETYHSR